MRNWAEQMSGFWAGTINAFSRRGVGGTRLCVSVYYETMARYRKELTHPERDITRLADATSQLRRELEEMVRHRRRTDRLVPEQAFAADAPLRKKKTKGR